MTRFVRQIDYKGADHYPHAPAVECKDVTVAYGGGENSFTHSQAGQPALENLTFKVQQGEQIAVIGPNGAGKSTLFKLIVGIMRPTRGKITLFGQIPENHICVAYVPQRSQIDWSFPVTVEDVVMMGRTRQIGLFRRPSSQDWDRVHASLERVSCLHLAKKQIGELSGGQQQRVFIARAVALEADLVLLDEPLAGLDVPGQEAILEILDTLRPDGVTILMATHDLNTAAERFDRVMLLNRQLVAYGPSADVFTTGNLLSAYGGKNMNASGEVIAQ